MEKTKLFSMFIYIFDFISTKWKNGSNFLYVSIYLISFPLSAKKLSNFLNFLHMYVYLYMRTQFLTNKFKQTNLLQGLINICEHNSRSG